MSGSQDSDASLSDWSFSSDTENDSSSDFADASSSAFSMSSESILSEDTYGHCDTLHEAEKGCFSDAREIEKTACYGYGVPKDDQ